MWKFSSLILPPLVCGCFLWSGLVLFWVSDVGLVWFALFNWVFVLVVWVIAGERWPRPLLSLSSRRIVSVRLISFFFVSFFVERLHLVLAHNLVLVCREEEGRVCKDQGEIPWSCSGENCFFEFNMFLIWNRISRKLGCFLIYLFWVLGKFLIGGGLEVGSI